MGGSRSRESSYRQFLSRCPSTSTFWRKIHCVQFSSYDMSTVVTEGLSYTRLTFSEQRDQTMPPVVALIQEYENNGKFWNRQTKKWLLSLSRGGRFERLQLQWFGWENFGVVDRWLLMGGGQTWKNMNFTLTGLSKSQNWLTGPWLDKSFWQSNKLFPRISLKSHLLRARYLGFD